MLRRMYKMLWRMYKRKALRTRNKLSKVRWKRLMEMRNHQQIARCKCQQSLSTASYKLGMLTVGYAYPQWHGRNHFYCITLILCRQRSTLGKCHYWSTRNFVTFQGIKFSWQCPFSRIVYQEVHPVWFYRYSSKPDCSGHNFEHFFSGAYFRSVRLIV